MFPFQFPIRVYLSSQFHYSSKGIRYVLVLQLVLIITKYTRFAHPPFDYIMCPLPFLATGTLSPGPSVATVEGGTSEEPSQRLLAPAQHEVMITPTLSVQSLTDTIRGLQSMEEALASPHSRSPSPRPSDLPHMHGRTSPLAMPINLTSSSITVSTSSQSLTVPSYTTASSQSLTTPTYSTSSSLWPCLLVTPHVRFPFPESVV